MCEKINTSSRPGEEEADYPVDERINLRVQYEKDFTLTGKSIGIRIGSDCVHLIERSRKGPLVDDVGPSRVDELIGSGQGSAHAFIGGCLAIICGIMDVEPDAITNGVIYTSDAVNKHHRYPWMVIADVCRQGRPVATLQISWRLGMTLYCPVGGWLRGVDIPVAYPWEVVTAARALENPKSNGE